jgi:NAD(P)-dependent dehydrogenase (short-subunit alcohol dehydrogenase family)
MVQLAIVRECNATLANRESLVAVFVGGTQGIGEYSIRALTAAYGKSGGKLRLYIVGRNEAAAAKIISDSQQICPSGTFQFVRANDIALLKDVDRVCVEIMELEKKASETPKVDILVMTQGYLAFEERQGKFTCLANFDSY